MGSPMQPNFIFTSLPIFPDSTSPVCMPIRISSVGRPRCWRSTFRATSARCCANAAAQAFAACASTSPGVFQKTRRPSPRISETTPSKSSTIRVISDRYTNNTNNKSWGDNLSEMVVKSFTSENMMETTRLSTYMRLALRVPFTIFQTTVSGTKRAKHSMLRESLAKPFMTSAISLTAMRGHAEQTLDGRSVSQTLGVSMARSCFICFASRCRGREIMRVTLRPRQMLSIVITKVMIKLTTIAQSFCLSDSAFWFATRSEICRLTSMECCVNASAGKATTTNHLRLGPSSIECVTTCMQSE
mmetsp:Transcript_21087/g.53857  ORF Transcript_21087/g.53857 Transcript_21087/m.53857 type:complete len:301 (+) Transcript_21087:424-1326(+)